MTDPRPDGSARARAVSQVQVLGADDWVIWRDIRLRALAESPGAFGATYADELAFPERVWRDRLGGDGVCVLVLENGRPVAMGGGFVDLPCFVHVVAMWVEPSARGHGLGHRVLDAVRDWATARGRRLHLDVADTNPSALRCYERYGFVLTGERRPLRDGAAELAERMVLTADRDASAVD